MRFRGFVRENAFPRRFEAQKVDGFLQMENQGLVSVVLPCYNCTRYLLETVRSVQAQSYPYWELLAVDDGSTDGTAELLRKLTGEDARIKAFYLEHKGSAAARNAAIRAAGGRYIALLDADDVWMPQFLEKQIALLRGENAVCVCSSYGFIDENSARILRPVYCRKQILLRDMMVMNRVGCLTGLYDCSRYGKIFLDESLGSLRDDYAYYLKIAQLDGVIYGNPEILARHRVRNGSTTRRKLKLVPVQYKFYREYLKISRPRSVLNTAIWGIRGLQKFAPFDLKRSTRT